MKHLIALFLLCSFSVQNDDFYANVLSKNSSGTRFGYYVAIPIYNNGDTVKCIVTSHFLYTYLSSEKNNTLSYEQYSADMQEILAANKGIEVRVPIEQLHERWRFQKVEQNNEVDSIARFGRDYFIQYYFDDDFIKDGILNKEEDAIIYHLFKWKVGTKKHHESGYLYIPEELQIKQ